MALLARRIGIVVVAHYAQFGYRVAALSDETVHVDHHPTQTDRLFMDDNGKLDRARSVVNVPDLLLRGAFYIGEVTANKRWLLRSVVATVAIGSVHYALPAGNGRERDAIRCLNANTFCFVAPSAQDNQKLTG
jgi:hypothetical protein